MSNSTLAALPHNPSIVGTDLFYTVPMAGTADYNVSLDDIKGYALNGLSMSDVSGLVTALANKQALNSFLTMISALVDPNADRMLFWDDSAGQFDWLSPGTNLSITGTTLNASGGSGGGDVSGPGAPTVVNELAVWNNTSGTLVKRSTGTGVLWLNSGLYNLDSQLALSRGGTGSNLSDPNVDAILFWDDSAGGTTFLTMGTAITISGTTLNVSQASTTQQGVSEFATASEYRAGTDTTRSLVVSEVWSAATEQTLTDAATIAVDMSTFLNATVTLAGARTLGNPTNAKPGQSGVIRVLNDATGGRTLAYASNYKFAGGVAPVISTAPNAQDLLFYHVVSSTYIFVTIQKAVG